MSDSTLFLHIGMPKAASSYLHGTIFPAFMPGRYLMPGAANAKKPAYRFRRNSFSVSRFSDAFQAASDFWERHGDEFLIRFVRPYLSPHGKPDSMLISDEAVTRLNHFNIRAMPSAADADKTEKNFRMFAESAQNIGFSRTKILFVIRRQDALLAASYAQLSRKIIGASQADFEERVHRLIARDTTSHPANFYALDYLQFYECLTRALGKHNITVLVLEELAQDFTHFIKKLAAFFETETAPKPFIQTRVNSRASGSNQWRLRRLLLLKTLRGKLDLAMPRSLTGREAYIELTANLSQAILSYYSQPNQMLGSLIETDLRPFGYFPTFT